MDNITYKSVVVEKGYYSYHNSFFDLRNSTNSSVVKTLTKDCSLKCGSFDQIGHLFIDNDKARYSVSSKSEISDLANSRLSLNTSSSIIFICENTSSINALKSSSLIDDFSIIS